MGSHSFRRCRPIACFTDDGQITYYGTYTACDGDHTAPRLSPRRVSPPSDWSVRRTGTRGDFLWWSTGDNETLAWHGLDLRSII